MVFEAIGMDATTQKREEDDAGLSPKKHFLFRGLLREKPEKDTEKYSGMQGYSIAEARRDCFKKVANFIESCVRSDMLRTAKCPLY